MIRWSCKLRQDPSSAQDVSHYALLRCKWSPTKTQQNNEGWEILYQRNEICTASTKYALSQGTEYSYNFSRYVFICVSPLHSYLLHYCVKNKRNMLYLMKQQGIDIRYLLACLLIIFIMASYVSLFWALLEMSQSVFRIFSLH